MTAVAVARHFVNDARSKMVSSVIGSAGAGDPSNPGSPASLREPYAWWKTVRPPCPITTTPPGSFSAAIASFISVEIDANSVAGAGIPLLVTTYLAEAAATHTSKATATAMAARFMSAPTEHRCAQSRHLSTAAALGDREQARTPD